MSAGFSLTDSSLVYNHKITKNLSSVVTLRYNMRPGQLLPTLFFDSIEGVRKISNATWGLVPTWSTDPEKIFTQARAETVTQKKSFKDLYMTKRCLILADGYFDYAKPGSTSYYTTYKDKRLFFVGGFWRIFQGNMQVCLLTVEKTVKPKKSAAGSPPSIYSRVIARRPEFTKRVPVIVDPDYVDDWLDPTQDLPHQFFPVFQPVPDNEIRVIRVGREASEEVESPECLIHRKNNPLF